MSHDWKSFKIDAGEGEWVPASYNITWTDGKEYGRWARILRKDSHGLTMVARFVAPPGKAWRIVGRAPELGEEVYVMEGAYYNTAGDIIARPGTFMFNAPGALHGGISTDLTLFIHWCSGKPDEIVSQGLIDFVPREAL